MLGLLIVCAVMLCGMSVLMMAAAIAGIAWWLRQYREEDVFLAQRLCITLKRNEGEFTGLLVEKRKKRWTFEQVESLPERVGMVVPQFEGRLHVDPADMLFKQELPHADD